MASYCRYSIVSLSLYLLLFVAASAKAASHLDMLCEKFSSYDQNHDNQIEIASMRLLIQSEKAGPRAIMLVEARLVEPNHESDLVPHLKRWAADLEKEGCRADVVAVDLAKSSQHQDGRFVLAIRDFLKAVHAEFKLTSVVLVGHFPDSSIVRTINWRKRGDVTLHKGSSQPQTYKNVLFLSRKPELVAAKADVVLADLHGNWDKVYVQSKSQLSSTVVIFDDKIPHGGGACFDVDEQTAIYEDVFHVQDGQLSVTEKREQKDGRTLATVLLDDAPRDLECTGEDVKSSNVVAIPDIAVSRIDAHGIALNPQLNVVGVNGERLIDGAGRPQAVQFATKDDVPKWYREIWQYDEKFERKLLIEYFDRNHAYRSGEAKTAWRPSSIAHSLGSGYRVMLRAGKQWEKSDPNVRDIYGRPSLVDFVDWMQYPAVLRTLRAHSFPQGSQFEKTDYRELEGEVKGQIWAWSRRGDKLVPSLESSCRGGMLTWFLLRTLYENKRLANAPAFYHHTGCDGITPAGVDKYPYDHPGYGERQTAEALLFFGNGLALVGRAKVFYDEPGGFAEELAKGGSFGQAWIQNFILDSQATNLADISRKKAYFWSLLGDCTLRLTTADPIRESAN